MREGGRQNFKEKKYNLWGTWGFKSSKDGL